MKKLLRDIENFQDRMSSNNIDSNALSSMSNEDLKLLVSRLNNIIYQYENKLEDICDILKDKISYY